MNWELLIAAAEEARHHAHIPYSRFAVGAAVLTDDGEIYAGCNIENRTFGLTLCAERVAVGTAVASGARKLTAVAVVTDSNPPSPPCGLCRETLTEFAEPELPVLLATSGEDAARVEYRLEELLPHPFVFPPR